MTAAIAKEGIRVDKNITAVPFKGISLDLSVIKKPEEVTVDVDITNAIFILLMDGKFTLILFPMAIGLLAKLI